MKDPKILLVGGEKGGTGKTTIATNLASLLATKGNDVLMIDTDRQGSSSDWCYWRSQTDLPAIECIQLFGKHVKSETPKKANRYDKIIIDAGGRDSEELRYGMLVSDMMLTPVRASQYDISTLDNLSEVIEQLEAVGKSLPVMAVINSLKGNPNMPEFTEALEAIQAFDKIKAYPFAVRDRVSFARTGSEGRGVHEMSSPDAKAIAEIETIYDHIYGN